MQSARVGSCFLIMIILISLELTTSKSTGQKPENATLKGIGRINVIVLTYSRSGSSFSGELFSAYPSTSYIFEPLYYSAIKLKNRTSEANKEVITKLFSCDSEMLDEVRNDSIMVMVRRFGNVKGAFLEPNYTSTRVKELCDACINRVIKTIRLPLEDALQIIKAGVIPNLKIVHLVRDPRARYNSLMDTAGFWGPREKQIDNICGRMEQDLRLSETMLPSQYKLIKYEDLVANPKAVAEDVFAFIYGTKKLPEATTDYILRHTAKVEGQNREYYSTVRDRKFAANHWEKDLNQTTIEMLQNHTSCKYTLDKMNYPIKKFK